MLTVAYQEALVEVLEILNHTNPAKVAKIPKKLISFFNENASKTYEFHMDDDTLLKDLKLKTETKGLLSMLYSNYWCNAEEKEEFKKILSDNQKKYDTELREKYNPDNIFKTSEQDEPSNLPAVYKTNIFTKFIEKIKSLFHK